MSLFKQKIFAASVFISILGFVFLSPLAVKQADAILGVGDISFTTVTIDIPRTLYQIGVKIAGVFLRQLKTRMLKQIQNDLVNWVQGGGKPRFLTNPEAFLKNNAENAAAGAIDAYFGENGIDVCSPFKANLKILVQRATYLQEENARCSLGDIKDNLVNFKNSFTKGGGWTTWISLHETNNTLPGSYLAAIETISSKVTTSGNNAQMEVTAGKGFLNQKRCKKAKMIATEFADINGNPLTNEQITAIFLANPDAELNGEIFRGNNISYLDLPDGVLPQNENDGNRGIWFECAEEETVTPGSIVGDQISGALKSTGIDKLVNAKELGEILDAVIDAAVNRVAREGLSYVKSGRGSYTTPQTGSKSYTNRSRSETEVQGLEGFKASQLLTSLLEFKTSTEKLIRTIGRLGAESQSKISDFNTTLQALVSYSNLRTCGGSTTNTQEKIQACFYDFGVGLNKELNNPSVYKANQILLESTASLWRTIETKLLALQSNSSKMNSCNNISLILDPGPDQLPVFFPGNNDEGKRFYNWSGKSHTYTHYFDDPTNVNVSEIVSGMLSTASSQITSKSLEASTYSDKITSFSEQTASVEEDTNFIDGILTGVTLYANIMMDYDRAGRNITITGDTEPTSLVAEIQKYNAAMESKDETSVLSARRRLMSAKNITETNWQAAATAEKLSIITRARSIINSSRFIPEYILIDGEDGPERKLISEAIVGETVIINAGEIIPVDGFVVDGASRANKSRVTGEIDDIGEISKTSRSKVYAGYVNLDSQIKVKITGFMNESLQTGTGPSEAVGKALQEVIDPATRKPYLPFSLEQIGNELEIRGTRISKQQSDVTSKIGKFLTTPAEMAMAGVDGGDTEWEKYYYNRAQFAYAAIINWYITKNWGNCNTQ